MLQLPIMALFLRTIPEAILVVFLGYIILGKTLDRRRICVSGIILGMITYGVRMLPIYFGIHIIVILTFYIFLLYKVNNINLYHAVTASISTYILLIISEWLTMVIYVFLLNINPETLSQQSAQSTLMGMPSLLILFIIGILIKQFKKAKIAEVE